MATKTYLIMAGTAVAPNYWSILQDGGSAGASTAFGWLVKNTPTTTPYWRARLGAGAVATVAATTSYIDSAIGPTPGTGSSFTTASDSFITPATLTGQFASGNWTFNFSVRCTTASATGSIRCRVWASVNNDGSAGRELTSGAINCSAAGPLVVGTNSVSGATWNAPTITLNNEFLFIQCEWLETIAGTNANSNVIFSGAGNILTTDFALGAAISGSGAVVENVDAATGSGLAQILVSGAPIETGDSASGSGLARMLASGAVTEGADAAAGSGRTP